MDSNNILSTIAIIISVTGVIVQIINHQKVTSRCCKREASFSLDITNTTPTEEEIKKIDSFIKSKIEKGNLQIV
jgi:hypothetical protein